MSQKNQVFCPVAIRQITICLLTIFFGLILADEAAAAENALNKKNVPLNVLRTVAPTHAERGSELLPWPWAVNLAGKGHWFQTERAACTFFFKPFSHHARSVDVGCFQNIFKGRGRSFQLFEKKFDPIKNARHTAKLRANLYSVIGSWALAAVAFHSRTAKFATNCSACFLRIYAALDSQQPMQIGLSENRRPFDLPLTKKPINPGVTAHCYLPGADA